MLPVIRYVVWAGLFCTAAAAQTEPVSHYLLRMEPVRQDLTPQNLTEAEHAVIAKHAVYLQSLIQQGKLTLAGQALDPNGFWGIIIVNASGAEAATAILNGDPAVQAKIFRGRVIPFRIVYFATPSGSNP